jgi:hypothetical protein
LLVSVVSLAQSDNQLTMFVCATTVAAALLSLAGKSLADKVYKHVAAFSVDGLHGSDVGKYIALRPKSTIAKLLETGFEYEDAWASAVWVSLEYHVSRPF